MRPEQFHADSIVSLLRRQRMATLDKIKSTFDYVLGVVKEVAGVLEPLFTKFDAYSREKFGLSGGASLILGKLGIDAIGKLATPATLAAGIFGGGGLVGSTLADWWNGPGPAIGPPDNGPSANLDAGTVKDQAAYQALLAREEAERQARSRASDEADSAVVGALMSGLKSITVDQIGAGPRMLPQIAAVLRQAIVDGFRMVSGSDAAMPEARSTAAFVGDVLRSGTPAGVSQGVRALIEGGTGAGESVKLAAVNATGTPVNLTINGTTKTGIFPDDDAASLQRAFDGGLGGY